MKIGNDFNIIIAHRGPWMGLWMTINSCEMALRGSDYHYSYIVVANGDRELASDFWLGLNYLRADNKKLKKVIIHPAPMAPQNARQLGTVFADGDYLFFFDNHCLVEPNYFDRALSKMQQYGIEMLHSTTVFHAGSRPMHQYELSLDGNFWTRGCVERPQHKTEPYRVAMGGHGGFVVKRSTFEEVGGYWMGMKGYGGEEPYFDLKMWLLGKEVWLDPKLIHYHFPGDRGYARHYTDDFYRNMMMAANLIGGGEWMDKVADAFRRSSKAKGKNIFDLYLEAEERTREHANELAAVRQRTLDEQLAWFADNNIPH